MFGLFRNSGCFNSSQSYETKNKPTNISETIFNKAQNNNHGPIAEVVIVMNVWFVNFVSCYSHESVYCSGMQYCRLYQGHAWVFSMVIISELILTKMTLTK